ncbi:MAG: chemotaxis protein CheW [Verrucomicrobiota bacterium]
MPKKPDHPVLSLLDRPHPEGYREEWVKRVQGQPEEEQHETIPLLVFRLDQEWLALNCRVIKEVCQAGGIHRIPRRTNAVLHGVTNIRGELQLAVSLRSLLGINEKGKVSASMSRRVYERIILIEHEREAFAFRVDEVFGVVPFEVEEMQSVPVTVGKALATFSRGIFHLKNQHVGYLDEELIFHSLSNQYL